MIQADMYRGPYGPLPGSTPPVTALVPAPVPEPETEEEDDEVVQ